MSMMTCFCHAVFDASTNANGRDPPCASICDCHPLRTTSTHLIRTRAEPHLNLPPRASCAISFYCPCGGCSSHTLAERCTPTKHHVKTCSVPLPPHIALNMVATSLVFNGEASSRQYACNYSWVHCATQFRLPAPLACKCFFTSRQATQ
jgi:hypothetical protein